MLLYVEEPQDVAELRSGTWDRSNVLDKLEENEWHRWEESEKWEWRQGHRQSWAEDLFNR